MANDEPRIQSLKTENELKECAQIMSSTEPWITLKFSYQKIVGILSDPLYEVYILYIKSEIAGFSIVVMKGSLVGYIKGLVIKPEWRNKHLGEKLLKFSEERIYEEYPNVFLCVSSFNPRAQKFYLRLGYKYVGELKDYIIKGQSELLLRKSIGLISDYKPS